MSGAGDVPREPEPARGIPAGIADEIRAAGGRVTFAGFMALALTHPTEGYYCRTHELLGPRGHFTTAPRVSPDFRRAIGRLVEELVDAASKVDTTVRAPRLTDPHANAVMVIEVGAGEGDLAGALLAQWGRERPDLRASMTYTLVEVGEHLRSRQREALAGAAAQGWRLAWAGSVDEALAAEGRERAAAVVIGNEFVDALPVHLVDVGGKEPVEAWVELAEPGKVPWEGRDNRRPAAMPREVWGALSPEAEAELRAAFGTVEASALRPLTSDGHIELRPEAGDLLRLLAATVRSACLLTVDYGEWFIPPDHRPCEEEWGKRYGRTLRGYFRHSLVTDPYVRIGWQDLTADVDFQALDRHGRAAGFETVLFSTVARLLEADGAEGRLEQLRLEAGGRSDDPLAADRRATALAALLDPQGLGGAFKVMLQVKEP